MNAEPLALATRIRERNRERSWLLRAPLLVWFVLLFNGYRGDVHHHSIWGGLNLGIHELGHFLFLLLPEFWSIAGGTITQLAIPIVVGILFLRQKDDFAVALALFWLATNLLDIAPYAADARTRALPLVTPFAGVPQHDWAFLLGELGILDRDREVAALFRTSGLWLMALSTAAGGWVLWLMATDPGREEVASPLARVGRGGGEQGLEAEGERLRAWLLEERAVSGGDGLPGSGAEDPSGDLSSESAQETTAPEEARRVLEEKASGDGLTPEEARFLEWLQREEG